MSNQKYLGDGVYASFDGYQIWLAVNNHENKVVALDSSVITQLQEFIDYNITKRRRYTELHEKLMGSDSFVEVGNTLEWEEFQQLKVLLNI